MPAMTAIAASTACRVGRSIVRAVTQFAHRIRNRRAAEKLSGLDDRMLADIGLTRSDLRDAYAEPLWHDPTDILARRVAERRTSRFRPGPSQPRGALPNGWCRPSADRRALT